MDNIDLFVSGLGVVVIGRNEAVRLQDTLQSVVKVGVPLIYVDSQSKDDSVKLARSLDVEVIVLTEEKPINASRARNQGARALITKFPNLNYLQFLDGDTVLDSEWLEAAFIYMEANPHVGFVSGQLREKDRDNNVYRRLCDMEWRWEATKNAEPCRLGGMGVMRLSAYLSSGGYDESLIAGADPELYSRLVTAGWSLHVLQDAMGIHDSGMQSFQQWWTRNLKSGFGFANGQATGAWGRERRSAILWGGIIPLSLLVITMLITNWALLLLIVYPVNVYRIWVSPAKKEFSQSDRWLYASACMASKVSQFVGIVKYYWRKQMKQTASVIQYK